MKKDLLVYFLAKTLEEEKATDPKLNEFAERAGNTKAREKAWCTGRGSSSKACAYV